METLNAELTEFQTLKDLKPILASEGPCLSIYLRINPAPANQSAKAASLEWRDLIQELQGDVQRFGAQGRELLNSISDWDQVAHGEIPERKGVAVFRSPQVFCVTWLDETVQSRTVAAPHFYVRPLVEELTRGKLFYLLALSQNDVRLLRCTFRTSEEIELPKGVVNSFDAWMNSAKPDHVSDSMATGGPSTGHMKGVMFTTSSEREDKGEYLAHFFRQIDRGVNETLRGSTEPLIVAGVEYELALYRQINSYQHLAPEEVRGAPNGLKAGEMHARAIEALQRCYEQKAVEALAEYNHKVGAGASNRLQDVVTAAHEGRVLTLLVSASAESIGEFDENTFSVKGSASDGQKAEDLVNDAAVQAVLHAAQVYVVPASKMPDRAPVAAIFRF